MKYTVINVKPDESKKLVAIQKNDGFTHAYFLTTERLHRLFSNGEEFFGALNQEKELIGFASINMDVVRLRIHFFFIDQRFQKKGVGSALLAHILSIAKKEKVSNIYTYTEIESPLEQFLIHRGFEKAGYFKRRFGDKDANILSMHV